MLFWVGCATGRRLTRLEMAAAAGQADIVAAELAKGGQSAAYRNDALVSASRNGHLEIVKRLLDHGAASPNTALAHAALGGHQAVVDFLLSRGATDLNTALLWAASQGQDHLVTFLLAKGTHIEVKSQDQGWTPLCAAANNGHAGTVRLLLEKGADARAVSVSGGDSRYPLTILSFVGLHGHYDIARMLIEKGADAESAVHGLRQYAARWDPNDRHARPYLAQANSAIDMLNALIAKPTPAAQPAASSVMTQDQVAMILRKVQEASAPVAAPQAAGSDLAKPSFSPSGNVFGETDHAIVIGIERYPDLPQSDYSASDATLVREYLAALGIPDRNIQLLINERATKSGIEKALEAWLVNRLRGGERVVVYYSGHGAPDAGSREAYLVPFDGDPNYLAVTGYPLKRLYQKLGRLPASEVVVVLDSCFSGAGGRSVLAKGARPLVTTVEAPRLPPTVSVLAAARGSQISTSSPEAGHGILTYYFLRALRDGAKDLQAVYERIRPQVEDQARRLNVEQSPQLLPAAQAGRPSFRFRK